jgi:hypothetical protein
MGHLYFDSTDAFQTAFAPHAQAIMADIPNYTNTQPTIQISEVKMCCRPLKNCVRAMQGHHANGRMSALQAGAQAR